MSAAPVAAPSAPRLHWPSNSLAQVQGWGAPLGGASGKSDPSTSFMRNTPPSKGVPAARAPAPPLESSRALRAPGKSTHTIWVKYLQEPPGGLADLGRRSPPGHLRYCPRSRSPASQAGRTPRIQNLGATASLLARQARARAFMPSSGLCCSSRNSLASLFMTAGLRPSAACRGPHQ